MNHLESIDERFGLAEYSRLTSPDEIEERSRQLMLLIANEILDKCRHRLLDKHSVLLKQAGIDLRYDPQDDGSLWLNSLRPDDPQFLAIDVVVSGHFGKVPSQDEG